MARRKKKKPAPTPPAAGTRRRNVVIGGIVVSVLAVIAILVALALGSRESQRDVVTVYHGIQGGFTEEGFPYLGSLEAPVVLVEFTDFNCSHCQAYNLQSEDGILADYVATGQVRYVLHFYSSTNPRSWQAAEAAMCAADQGLYFQFQRALFESPTALREDFIARARDVGLDVGEFTACWDAGRHHNALMGHIRAAGEMGISVTPSFRVNDQLVVGNRPDMIRQAIDDELVLVGQQ
ncbi:MAG: thioredoxin domain-containing protein [Chloroflexota bacterium]|nr:thioredoxin domain-containing protein [Chloroflexota bacterium]